jgi:hypothetical protein
MQRLCYDYLPETIVGAFRGILPKVANIDNHSLYREVLETLVLN